MLMRALIRAAIKKAESGGQTKPIDILTSIITGRFEMEFTDGKTVISTAEAGGSVSFATMPGLMPDDVLALAEEAIERLEAGDFGDKDAPTLTSRRIKRLRASFAKAVTS